MTTPVVLTEAELRDFTERILEVAGVPPDRVRKVAAPMVAANLRGIDSHGVQLLPHYVDQLEAGDVDPRAEGQVVSESGACLLYDSQHPVYREMHDGIIKYLCFLRDRAVEGELNPGSISQWLFFKALF